MKISEKDRRALGIIRATAKCNMEILEVQSRLGLLPRRLRDSTKGKRLRKIFAKRDELEDKTIGENPRATDARFVNLATNRRNIYLKAFLSLRKESETLITELESTAWRNEHPVS
jgi:hypothetical protein